MKQLIEYFREIVANIDASEIDREYIEYVRFTFQGEEQTITQPEDIARWEEIAPKGYENAQAVLNVAKIMEVVRKDVAAIYDAVDERFKGA